MRHTRDEFSEDYCPNCGGGNVRREHNISNIGFLKGAGYFLDFPFGANYTCKDCGETNDDPCFVATVVYGDPNAYEVETLREIRDEVLMKNPAGRKLVNFYYSGAGRRTAKFIEEKIPGAIPLIRGGLDLIVELYD